MFRPQFAYLLPASPCFDQKCQYSFDKTNTPIFAGTLAAGAETGLIPLSLDRDGSDFLVRGLSTQGAVSFRLEDTRRNPLSDSENAVQSTNYELPNEYSNTSGAGIAVLESGNGGLRIPAGGNFRVYLFNAGTGAIDLTTCVINLHGVKRYPGEVCP